MRKFVQTFARFVFNLMYLVDFMSTLGAIVLVVELVGAHTHGTVRLDLCANNECTVCVRSKWFEIILFVMFSQL